MSNKFLKLTILFFPALTLGLTSCGESLNVNDSGSQVLRVLNWEDYIYEQDIEEGYTEDDLVNQFEAFVKENYPQYKNVKVIYETTDTNETMYNELQTGKTHYDLVCPSDYMIQKLLSQNLLEKLDRNLLPNYTSYVSEYMRGQLDNISAVNKVTGETEYLKDYAAGYMWGTLGLVFNPGYQTFEDRGYSEEKVISDMQTWSTLWNEEYKGTISVKDSMRDTYAIGVIETYKGDLRNARNDYLSGITNEVEYNTILTDIFNRCAPENIKDVEKTLSALKENVFGLEVDSGKQDIVTGKIGINFAWSGDACYSIAQAGDAEQVSNPFDLLYSIPELGSNIWFDGWCMPKDEARSDAQYELAHLFIDFLSMPENAIQNMDYIGYTSFVGGDAVVEMIRDWYDIRTELVYFGDEQQSLYYVDPIDGEEYEVDYSDCHLAGDSNVAYDDVELFIYDEESNTVSIDETYNERLIIDENWEVIDLAYIFEDTLTEYGEEDSLFYSDNYLPYVNEDGSQNISVGSSFFCQYPNKETMIRCAVMKDFGENNSAILQMWENFKSDPLPTWAVILFAVEISLIVGFVCCFVFSKTIKLRLRKKRKEQKSC